MKTRSYFFFGIVYWLTTVLIAQNGINYKAIIKDSNGDIVSNTLVVLQFGILEGTAQTNVYTEQHTPTTNAEGLVILNIGNGTPISGDFSTILWSDEDHFLNVQVNTGGGLTDLGTILFLPVPYALHANTASNAQNVTGLETLNEGNGAGWRLVGRNENQYGNIGIDGVDLSRSTVNSTTNGATGNNAVAFGRNTEASGDYSTAMGFTNTAEGLYSFAVGQNTVSLGAGSFTFGIQTEAGGDASIAGGLRSEASGNYATAFGYELKADALRSATFGSFNVGGGSATTWVNTNPIFEIGNGQSINSRSNALTILKNGTIMAPSFDVAEITDNKALVTKEYIDTQVDGGQGLEQLDEGNGIGWRLKTRDPVNYGDIGENAVDLSTNLTTSSNRGATGQFTVATGIGTTASGVAATSIGNGTTATGANSLSAGFLSEANGSISTSFGQDTRADSFGSFVIGRYNAGGGNPTSWNDNEPLFEIGNGTSDTERETAFSVRKNGSTTIVHADNDNGLFIVPDLEGFVASFSEACGIQVIEAPSFGIGIRQAGSDGVHIDFTGRNGLDVNNAGENGVLVRNAENIGGVFNGLVAGVSANSTTDTNADIILEGNSDSEDGDDGIMTSDLDLVSSDLVFKSNDDVIVELDNNTDEIGEFVIQSGFNTPFRIDELGSANIRANPGATAPALTLRALDQIGLDCTSQLGHSITGRFNGLFLGSTGPSGIPDIIISGVNESGAEGDAIISTDPNFSSSDMFITSYDNIVFQLDVDNDEVGTFEVKNSSNIEVFEVRESGNATLAGTLTQNSDIRLKKDIEDLSYGLSEVNQLQPKSYLWKGKDHENEDRSIGLIAQDVQKVLPEMVSATDQENDTLGVSYIELIPVLINAIKEQQLQIENLRSEVNHLKFQNKKALKK